MNQTEVINPPIQGSIWAIDVAAAATGAVDFWVDIPTALETALKASGQEPKLWWASKFVSVRAVGGAIVVAVSNSTSPTLQPTTTGNSDRVGVTIPDGQQMDFRLGTYRYLKLANGGAGSVRVEVWVTSVAS